MSLKFAAILLESGILAMGPPLLAAEVSGIKQPAQVTKTERVEFAPGGTLRINGSVGDLDVEGWDRPEVEITVIKAMPYDYKLKEPEQATKHLERVSVVTERKSATELAVSTDLPRRRSLSSPFVARRNSDGVAMKYEIRVPRDSRLVIHHGTGSVLVTNTTGDIEASGGRGDIMLMLPDSSAYMIDAKSKFGTVTSDFEGTGHLNHLVGERYSTANPPSSHRIQLRMGFGGITIKAVPPEASTLQTAK